MLETIYQLCPPLFSLGMLRIDSPLSHALHTYERDKEFFDLHKGRRLYIRADYMGEFDIEMSLSDHLRVPRLHVLVTQLEPGVHQVTPVYRGKQFFYDNVPTDAEVALVLVEMARRKGMNPAEWTQFETEWLERASIALATSNGEALL